MLQCHHISFQVVLPYYSIRLATKSSVGGGGSRGEGQGLEGLAGNEADVLALAGGAWAGFCD